MHCVALVPWQFQFSRMCHLARDCTAVVLSSKQLNKSTQAATDARLLIKPGGQSKGCAYVQFANDGDVEAALHRDKHFWRGKHLFVARSRPPGSGQGVGQRGHDGGGAGHGRGSGHRGDGARHSLFAAHSCLRVRLLRHLVLYGAGTPCTVVTPVQDTNMRGPAFQAASHNTLCPSWGYMREAVVHGIAPWQA